MKKTKTKIMLLLAFVCYATSCTKDHLIKGKGPDVVNVRTMSGFSGVSLSFGANIEIYRDSVFRIELNGQQNILNVITTSVNGNTLDVDLKRFTAIRKHNPITLKIYMPDLNSIQISGSGDIICKSSFITENLNANVSGSGNISFYGTVNNSLNACISGSGGMQFNSNKTCLIAKYTVSGSGNMNAEWLKSDNVDAHISGSGDMRISAAKQLNAHISGSGDIAYRGTPGISAHISGSGKLRQIQ